MQQTLARYPIPSAATMMQHPLLLARYPVHSAATVMQHLSYFETIVRCIIDATNARSLTYSFCRPP